jgi:hypothetical protein
MNETTQITQTKSHNNTRKEGTKERRLAVTTKLWECEEDRNNNYKREISHKAIEKNKNTEGEEKQRLHEKRRERESGKLNKKIEREHWGDK